MRDHVRVLEARVEPEAVGPAGLRRERARDGDEQQGEERGDAAEDRHDPGDEVTRAAAAPTTVTAAKPVRIRSQRSSEPSWPPQNAEIV